MIARGCVSAVTAALAVAAIAGCGGGGSLSTNAARGNLRIATSYLRASSGSSFIFEFADWSRIESRLGVKPGELTTAKSSSAITQALGKNGQVPAGNVDYDLGLGGPRRLWSATDVTWDAIELPAGESAPPLAMTGLSDGFDMSAVGKHLKGCGFTAKSVDGVTTYSGSPTAVNSCVGVFGADIPDYAQFALDTNNHAVLMSNSLAAIAAALKASAAQRTLVDLEGALGPMSGDEAVAVGVGPGFCGQLSKPQRFAGRNATPQLVQRVLKAFPPARQYAAFGLGLAVTPSADRGQVVFVYGDASTAKADLPDRERRLRTGQSFVAQEPYNQLVRVVSGHTSANTAVLDVAQPPGRPIELTNMLNQNDLGFARCG
jgi:hypothetical protein